MSDVRYRITRIKSVIDPEWGKCLHSTVRGGQLFSRENCVGDVRFELSDIERFG